MANQMLPEPSATPAHGFQQPDDTESAPLLADAAAVVLSSSSSQVIIKDEVRSARKDWLKEQAAAHLACSTASHTSAVLRGWRETAAAQRRQRLAIKQLLQRHQQHSMAQAFVEWQLYFAAKNDLRSIGARLAQQTTFNTLKLCFGARWQECHQQQASRLQRMAARLLQRWKVAVEMRQADRVQAAATLAAIKKVKLAQAFAAWHQHCRRSQRSKEVGAAIMAKRRTNLLAYSLLTMQADAAKQANKKQQMHSAEQLHRLHVQLEAFAAWRAFTQCSSHAADNIGCFDQCSSHAADNTGCFDQDCRARVHALVARRKAYLLGCSLVTLQHHADSNKQLMHKAEHFHRLNVLREGFISLRLDLQQARRKSADRAYLASHSYSAAAPPNSSPVPRALPPLLARAPSLLELAKRGPPASARHKPLLKSLSSSDDTISAAASSGQTHSLHRSVSDKQWSSVGANAAQTAHDAAQLGLSSGRTAAGCLSVHQRPQGPLQPGDGNNGIMVQRMQQLSGVSAMCNTNSKADTNRKPSFSQGLGSAPPGGSVYSLHSGLRMEAGLGSLTPADGSWQDTQQLRQEPSFGSHDPPSLMQQDSSEAELYASMLGPMYDPIFSRTMIATPVNRWKLMVVSL
ncbi:MAG: hypothetical protein FRX49_06487 [Trebouxia sp. A1-2]|nr:MAG: hypothetical protein FRX49_06487 [Trebouxia sp. A1-2]